MVLRIGMVDSAAPHPDPCGGQAPALHFLIPPSAISLQFGTFRPWRAGIEVDWRAHFRTNDEVRADVVSWPANDGFPGPRQGRPRGDTRTVTLVVVGRPACPRLGALVQDRRVYNR